MAPDSIFLGVLAFMWAEFLWEAYIGSRQRKVYRYCSFLVKTENKVLSTPHRTNTSVPSELKNFLDDDTFTKARLYALDK